MAKKYIDADLLRKEIESRMGDCDANSKNPNQLLWAELAALIPFIDSLQQEQHCEDLTEEVKRYYSDNFAYINGDAPTLSIVTNIARHFYELGKQAKKEE